jgi:hypothetical protein
MESLTRLVSESLARHGFDRPLDYRRLHWSRWFRCESHHSLLSVPSKPGVFAIAEEIMPLNSTTTHVGTAPWALQRSEASRSAGDCSQDCTTPETKSPKTEAPAEGRRMLAVTKFFEDDDMAFTLDRMLSWQNPMRARLESGRFFIRYVAIDDPAQRRSICSALNQWIASSTELATGIGSHFATSLEVTPAEMTVASENEAISSASAAPQIEAASRIRNPSSFPSGF